MNKRRTKYLRDLYVNRGWCGTVKINAYGEVLKERVRYTVVNNQWLAIPIW